jgi:SAM-dependent methyltransferase
MNRKINKTELKRALQHVFGKILSINVEADNVCIDTDENEILPSIAALPVDGNGIYIQHTDASEMCSLDGFDYTEKMMSMQNARSFFHIFRIWHGLKFLTDYTKEHSIIAELGAGYCEIPHLCHAAIKYYNYYCLEFDYKKLNTVAHRKVGRFNRVLVRTDLTRAELPFEDEEVDAIISFEFIEHIARNTFLLLLMEMNRILKGGCYMALSTPNIEVGKTPSVDHLYEYTYTEFCKLLEATGFTVIKSFGIGVGRKQDLSKAKESEFYKTMNSFFPTPLVSQLAFISHPDKCRSFSVFCRKTAEPNIEAMADVDFSVSEKMNESRRPE